MGTMGTANPALSLPQTAFELILGDPILSTRDKCSVEATCRAWRELARSTAATAATVVVPGRLDTEERLDSLGLWLFRRAEAVRHLQFEHFQCQRLDPIAQNILETVASSLTSLSLTLSKHQRNRRGVPGPASLAWVPTLPALRRLDLTINWETEAAGWGITRWAPNLDEMALRWCADHPGRSMDQFEGATPALPPNLRHFTVEAVLPSLHTMLQPSWAASLRSLHINWPAWADGEYPFSAVQDDATPVRSALSRLTALEELCMNVSTFGDDYVDVPAEEWGQTSATGAEAAMHAVHALTGLRTLKLAGIADDQMAPNLAPLTRLETLHLFGGPIWGFLKFPPPLPALKELALITADRDRDMHQIPHGVAIPLPLTRPGLNRLILNADGSAFADEILTGVQWVESKAFGRTKSPFAPLAQTLEELVIVETKRIAPLYESTEGHGDIVQLPRGVILPVFDAGRGKELRLAIGDTKVAGHQCVSRKWRGKLRKARVGAPPAELLAEVAAWGEWRLGVEDLEMPDHAYEYLHDEDPEEWEGNDDSGDEEWSE